jgi:hypothetical protein
MRWLTGQCSWTTTLGHIEPELYNIFLQQEAVQTIPWPAMSPDMNPIIEHIWDFISRKINQRERAHCHGIFGLSDNHQERTSSTYSQRKNNPRQLHPHPQKQWDFISRKINQRNPKCQNVDELRTAILQEWQKFPQERLRRMIVEMGDYAWSEHIVTVFLACQITIKNVQVQLTVKGKTTPRLFRQFHGLRCRQT